MARNSSLTLLLTGLLASATGLGTAGTGCGDSGFNLTGGGNEGGSPSSNGGAGGGEGGTFVDNGAELFAALEPDLVAACGACHEPGGIGDAPFIAPPDRYQSILSWPGIVVKNPDESLFVTYAVMSGGHSGTNLDAPNIDLADRVREWLDAEAAAISDPIEEEEPHVDPITPILGFNAIYLTPLGDDLEGIAITFSAELLTENSIKLNNLQIHTTSATGVHIVHPVFAVYPKGKDGSADPVDSFAGLDERYGENTSSDLGVGLVILTNWEPEAKLGIGFELIEPYSDASGEGGGGGGGGGPGGGCNALAEFEANAKPQFDQRCFSCHGGGNGQATAAVDMSDLDTNPDAACVQIRNRVNLDTPAQSQIFITTDPGGNAAHPFKFGGNAGQFNTFRDAVTTWIEAE
ncbi:MAG: hypothetical protein HOW73_26565 [Polyangiaceae bacterium]|nr:hypothetical protein [Polyangiaceae bacterium]